MPSQTKHTEGKRKQAEITNTKYLTCSGHKKSVSLQMADSVLLDFYKGSHLGAALITLRFYGLLWSNLQLEVTVNIGQQLKEQFIPETTGAYFIVDWDTINTILGSFWH